MAGRNFIAGMHMKKGAFTAQAKAAGATPAQFQARVLKKGSGASPATKKRAVLRRTLVGLGAKRNRGA